MFWRRNLETAGLGCPQKVVFWKSITVRSSTTSIASESDLIRRTGTHKDQPEDSDDREEETREGRVGSDSDHQKEQNAVGHRKTEDDDEEDGFHRHEHTESQENEKRRCEENRLGEILGFSEKENAGDRKDSNRHLIGQLLSARMMNQKSGQTYVGNDFAHNWDSGQGEKNRCPEKNQRRTNEVALGVNPRVSHVFMTHPTDTVGIVGEIGTKAGIVDIGRSSPTPTGNQHRFGVVIAEADAAFH
jgi:hypothetical protein